MAADWPWDESLDALVAAPAQHRLVFENAHVRVLDTRIAPGERTPVHTHRWAASHSLENVGSAALHIISTEVKAATPGA